MSAPDASVSLLQPFRLDRIAELYCIGIGGIGMSALARWFKSQGIPVRGYDRTAGPMVEALRAEGIPVHTEPDPDGLPQAGPAASSPEPGDIKTDRVSTAYSGEMASAAMPASAKRALVVYTPAVSDDFPELVEARARGLALHKRAAVLGAITADRKTVAVAGSHGKTTVSAMIAHLLMASGRPVTAFLGGIPVNYNSNLVQSTGDHQDPERVFVVEADEYDRSFLQLEPDVAVVTATDPDHLDIYGSEAALLDAFGDFVRQIKPQGQLLARWGLDVHEYFAGRSKSYDLQNSTADFHVHSYRMDENGSHFRCTPTGREWHLPWPGEHNIENALAAIGTAELLGLPEERVAEALSNFQGIRRRFEYRVRRPDAVLIDDYAHHPREIARLLDSVKHLYGRRKRVAVFQPHLFSRTRDLLEGFAEALAKADHILLLPIYPAREKPIPGIDSALLARRIIERSEQRRVECVEREALVQRVHELAPELLICIGAGDIELLLPALEEGMRARSSGASSDQSGSNTTA
jgi:UDP-N-acetylmuramate--alanine ligase